MSTAPAKTANIQFLDLKAQYASIKDEILGAVHGVLEAQHFILGPEVQKLELEIANECGRNFGIGVASGTDALILALKACDVGPGDEVIVPPFSFIASADSISMLGATPVFVDIQRDSFNLNPDLLERAITPNTKAIVVVHLYGQPADMDPIMEIARQRRIKVIEDTAQAIGARYHGRQAAGIGDIGCVSFFPSKNLGGYGDGGMILTNSKETAERLRSLRAHGSKRKYVSDEIGWNSRLDELQAAILRVKLRHLSSWADARAEKAAVYDKLLAGCPQIQTPKRIPGTTHVFHQYTVRVPNRDAVQKRLAEAGVPTMVYYPMSICLQPVYRHLGYQPGDMPETDRAITEVLSLPIYPELSETEQSYIANELIDAVTAEISAI